MGAPEILPGMIKMTTPDLGQFWRYSFDTLPMASVLGGYSSGIEQMAMVLGRYSTDAHDTVWVLWRYSQAT